MTLTVVDTDGNGTPSWKDHKTAIDDYFMDKKHLTARRWEFLNKTKNNGENTKEFCTRLSQDAPDCEWDQMTNHEAIKLTVCLHTSIEKLRDEILVNDLKYDGDDIKSDSIRTSCRGQRFHQNISFFK